MWCFLFHKRKHIIGRSSGVTWGELKYCSKCNLYYFSGGFEGDVNSTVMDKTDSNLLKMVVDQYPKNNQEEIKKHIKYAEIQYGII